MKSRDMQIAEAVREKLMVSLVEQDLAYGVSKATLACFVANITRDVDLAAIIASMPKPEPVGDVALLNEENDYWLEKLPVGTHLYTAPPASEINRQLLDALKILVKFNTRDWYDGACAPAEVRIAKAAIAAAEKENR